MESKGKAITVSGPVEPRSLGQVLTHEHLSLDFSVAFTMPPEGMSYKTECDFVLPEIGWIRQNPYSHKKNIQFCGPEVERFVKEELVQYKKAGGGTIVENTVTGIQRNISLIKKLADDTDVKLVAGTGYYVSSSQSFSTLQLSQEALAESMRQELTVGCLDLPSVRCGLLGEVGCSFPLTEFEIRNIKAAGAVQEEVGCPVMFHPGRHHDAPVEIIRLYTEAGGSVGKAAMGHLDRTIHTMSGLEELAAEGCFLEYDLFGIETSHYQLNTVVDMPSDAQRIERIKHLIHCGYEDKILIAHDVHTRNRLSAYGGHGFSHIFLYVVPKMISRGISSDQVKAILETNPQGWLTFTK